MKVLNSNVILFLFTALAEVRSEGTTSNCIGQNNGKLYPLPNMCAFYIYCMGGEDIILPCPKDTEFSEAAQNCVIPSQSDCGTQTTKTTPTTTPSTCADNEHRTENQEACQGQVLNTIVPYPGNCSRYLICNCEYPAVEECAGELWFNNDLKTCDIPQDTQCEWPPTTITTAPTSTIAPTSGAPHLCPPPPIGIEYNFCDNKSADNFYNYPYNCITYLSCIDGCVKLNYCPPQKIFNEALNICDTMDSIECNDATNPTMATERTIATIITPDSTTVTTPITSNICINEADYTTFPYNENCTEFIICFEEKELIHACKDGRRYNPKLMICDEPANVPCFDMITTMPTTTTVAANPCLDEPAGTTFPFIQNCQIFVLCGSSGSFNLVACPYGEWYSPASGKCGACVSPNACFDVTATTTTPAVTTTEAITTTRATTTTSAITTTPAATTTASPSTLCLRQQYGTTFPKKDNCAQYIFCTGDGSYVILLCPESNYYNPNTGNCGPNISSTLCSEEVENDLLFQNQPGPVAMFTLTALYLPCNNEIWGQIVGYPNNCSKFIICGLPIGVAFDCDDDLEFDINTHSCKKSQAANCSTDLTAPTTTPSSGSLSHCYNMPDGTFLPNTTDCSEFIFCMNGKKIPLRCNPGTFYNKETTGCDSKTPPNDCKESNSKIFTSIPTTPLTPTTPSSSSRPCANLPDFTKLPNPTDCSELIVCMNGLEIPVLCTPGTYYNKETGNCDSQTSSTDCKEPISTPSTPLTTTSPTTSSRPCANLPDFTKLPNPTDCSEFVICMNGLEIPVLCYPGTYYNKETGNCDSQTSSTDCKEPIFTPSTPLTTTSPTTSSRPCANLPDFTKLPNPTDCSEFVICMNGLEIPVLCTPGTYYNKETGNCDSQTSSTDCKEPISTPSTPLTNTSPTTSSRPCANLPDFTKLPNRTDCSEFIICMNGLEIPVLCTPGTYYNNDISGCDSQTSANDCKEVSTTVTLTEDTTVTSTPQKTFSLTTPTIPFHITPPSVSNQQEICASKPSGSKFQYQGNCTKYNFCYGRVAYVLVCYNLWHFNPNLEECVPPQNYACPW